MTEERTPDEVGAQHLYEAAGAIDEHDELREQLRVRLPDFELFECLGRGGVGVVFAARQKRLERRVAIKVLLPPPRPIPDWQERFLREAKALARLTHPGIVAVYDFDRDEDLAWFVMEYVDGSNLRQLLGAGQLEPAEALVIVPQICAALEYAHGQGVVHRDIKPENILIDETGSVKLADFGLAKLMNAGAQARLTASDQAMGTLHYMAPEQLSDPTRVDHRADIYSLGVVIYEMLTGSLPQGIVQPPSERVHVDVRLDEVVIKSLQGEPEKRYQRVGEVKTRLEEIRGEASPPLPRADPPAPRQRGWARVRALAPVIACWVDAVLPPVVLILYLRLWSVGLWESRGLALALVSLQVLVLAVPCAARLFGVVRSGSPALAGLRLVCGGLPCAGLFGWVAINEHEPMLRPFMGNSPDAAVLFFTVLVIGTMAAIGALGLVWAWVAPGGVGNRGEGQ